jgi:hypothetical protein
MNDECGKMETKGLMYYLYLRQRSFASRRYSKHTHPEYERVEIVCVVIGAVGHWIFLWGRKFFSFNSHGGPLQFPFRINFEALILLGLLEWGIDIWQDPCSHRTTQHGKTRNGTRTRDPSIGSLQDCDLIKYIYEELSSKHVCIIYDNLK